MTCGEPVETEREDESAAWWQTLWEWLTRKSTIQRISLGLTSSFKSLLAMRCGCMVLTAEKKVDEENSDKWTCFFKMNICIVHCVASSVLLLPTKLYANWYGSKWGFVCFMSWWRMIRLKYFITIDVSAFGRQSFKQEGFLFFGGGHKLYTERNV